MDLLSKHNAPEAVAAGTEAIRQAVLRESRCITHPQFQKIGLDDLERLFSLYDRQFFDGWLGPAVKARTGGPLAFRLSRTMTRAGGKTTRIRRRSSDGKWREEYEIAVASRMLFMTFSEVERPVTVSGLPCTDRLQALQRIMEHEIIHLAELLVWGRSSCSRRRFKTLAASIFGHADTKHALVTPPEHAAVRHGLGLGRMVEFEFEGRRLVGRVNRIHRRATVLVEDAGGRRYSDGKRYQRFYVPLAMLALHEPVARAALTPPPRGGPFAEAGAGPSPGNPPPPP